MPFIDFFCHLVTYICQVEKTILIYRQETAASQDTHRMADAGLGIAQVSGKINGADHAMSLLEHQHRFQIILAG